MIGQNTLCPKTRTLLYTPLIALDMVELSEPIQYKYSTYIRFQTNPKTEAVKAKTSNTIDTINGPNSAISTEDKKLLSGVHVCDETLIASYIPNHLH